MSRALKVLARAACAWSFAHEKRMKEAVIQGLEGVGRGSGATVSLTYNSLDCGACHEKRHVGPTVIF